MLVYVKHILDAFDKEFQNQRCIICGEVIHDYSNTHFELDEQGNYPINHGWPEGEHYICQQANSILYLSAPDPNGFTVRCNTPLLINNINYV